MEDPTRQARRTTRHTGTGVGATSTCPICGLSFPTNRIAEHADRCAASTYVDELEATTGRGRAPPGGGLGGARVGRARARPPLDGRGRRQRIRALSRLRRRRPGAADEARRAARRAPRPRGAAAPAARARRRAARSARQRAAAVRRRAAPGRAPLAHGKTWRVPGGEAARLRGGSVIAAELPPRVLERRARGERARVAPARGLLLHDGQGHAGPQADQRVPPPRPGGGVPARALPVAFGAAPRAPPPPETRDARAERRSAADDAPPPPPPEPHQPKLLLRVRAGDDGARAAAAVADDDDDGAPAPPAPPRGPAPGDARPPRPDAASPQRARRRGARALPPRHKAPSNKEALEYVARMRSVHKLSPRTIATFVELLKAYKRKRRPRAARAAGRGRGPRAAARARGRRRGAAARARESDYTRAWRDRAGGAAPRLDLLAFAPAAARRRPRRRAAAPARRGAAAAAARAAPPPAADAARAAQYRQLQAYQLQQEHTRQLLERQRQLAGPAPPFAVGGARAAWRGAWVDYNGTLARLQAAGAPAADAGVREVVAAASRVIAAARTIARWRRARARAGAPPPPANNVGAPAMSAVAAANTIAALTAPPPAAAAARPPPRPDAAELLRRQRELLAARYGVGPRAAPRAADDPRFFHGGHGRSRSDGAYSDSDGDASNHAPAPAPGDGDASDDDDDDDDALDVARGAGDAAADDTGAKRATPTPSSGTAATRTDDARRVRAWAAVLGACDGGGPPPQSFDAMVERLRAVFRGEADDIVEAIVDAASGGARARRRRAAAEPPLDDDGAPRVEFLGERRKRFRGMPPPGAPGAAAPAPALEAALEAA
ncbi:hypothetical protein SO694_0002628 [Aureococcus anophagefferens]|uniref:UBZ4-type domain-containing protein n=1 Tax=Aureococcus anophagefferens TaxID=44056 RepID=A0ABR1FUK2_AURAN